MKPWPWKHRKQDEARLEEARAALRRARDDRPRVADVADRAERLSARNGFGDAIMRAMGEQRG